MYALAKQNHYNLSAKRALKQNFVYDLFDIVTTLSTDDTYIQSFFIILTSMSLNIDNIN